MISTNRVESKHTVFTAIDLFCGCGGLTQGLRRAGFQVVGAVDNDGRAAAIFKLNHPDTNVWINDIRDLSPRRIARSLFLRKGDLDLLAGCPPCQGFSTMRTLNGKHHVRDKQNELVGEFLRFVEALRPKAVMLENVPGLATNGQFKRFRTRLAEIGYEADHCVLNAADFGVPQRRRRLIYLAALKRKPTFARRSRSPKSVRDAIAHLLVAGCSGDPIHDLPERRKERTKGLIRRIPKNGGGRTDLSNRHQLRCHKFCDGFKDVYGRMEWDDVAPTITSGCFNPSKGRFLHPSKNRAITVREAALLQGFPRSYKFDVSYGKVALALMIGNALPPPFIAAHARQLRKLLALG